jgi:hypothetical protein
MGKSDGMNVMIANRHASWTSQMLLIAWKRMSHCLLVQKVCMSCMHIYVLFLVKYKLCTPLLCFSKLLSILIDIVIFIYMVFVDKSLLNFEQSIQHA